MTVSPNRETWQRWRSLVNMTEAELRAFKASRWGKAAGLSKQEAKNQGINSGRTSAEWLLRMIPSGRSFAAAKRNWSPEMWEWAQRQINFNTRMGANSGPLYKRRSRESNNTFLGDVDGKTELLEPTRLLLSLLIWGHDKERAKMGKRSLLLDHLL